MSQFNVIDATFQIRKSRRLLFCGCLGGRHEMSNIRQGKGTKGAKDNPKDSVALQHTGIYEAKKTAAVFHF